MEGDVLTIRGAEGNTLSVSRLNERYALITIDGMPEELSVEIDYVTLGQLWRFLQTVQGTMSS